MPVLRAISNTEYASWVNQTIPAYANDKVESGAWAEAESLAKSKAEHESLLPDGKDTKENCLYAICAEGGARVGMLWFSVKARAGGRIAYLYNIEIDAEHRRQGYAQRALRSLEEEVMRLGLDGIALHVFGHNTSAQALYAKLGYLPTNVNMYKALGAVAP